MFTYKQFKLRLDGVNSLNESFYIFRTDNNSVLARAIPDYESAKTRSNLIRKQLGLKWDQVSFKSEKKPTEKTVRQNFGKGIVKQPGEHIYATPSNNLSRIRLFHKYWDEKACYGLVY